LGSMLFVVVLFSCGSLQFFFLQVLWTCFYGCVVQFVCFRVRDMQDQQILSSLINEELPFKAFNVQVSSVLPSYICSFRTRPCTLIFNLLQLTHPLPRGLRLACLRPPRKPRPCIAPRPGDARHAGAPTRLGTTSQPRRSTAATSPRNSDAPAKSPMLSSSIPPSALPHQQQTPEPPPAVRRQVTEKVMYLRLVRSIH
jgi:hypothetical protein